MSHRPLEDWEYPDPDDSDDGDEAETLRCRSCGESVYEEAEQCPYCGDYQWNASRSPLAGRPWWYVVLAILGIIAVIATMTQM
jgi:hypothetical protein